MSRRIRGESQFRSPGAFRRLGLAGNPWINVDPGELIARVPVPAWVREAAEAEWDLLVLTGCAGQGKTTAARMILEEAAAAGRSVQARRLVPPGGMLGGADSLTGSGSFGGLPSGVGRRGADLVNWLRVWLWARRQLAWLRRAGEDFVFVDSVQALPRGVRARFARRAAEQSGGERRVVLAGHVDITAGVDLPECRVLRVTPPAASVEELRRVADGLIQAVRLPSSPEGGGQVREGSDIPRAVLAAALAAGTRYRTHRFLYLLFEAVVRGTAGLPPDWDAACVRAGSWLAEEDERGSHELAGWIDDR